MVPIAHFPTLAIEIATLLGLQRLRYCLRCCFQHVFTHGTADQQPRTGGGWYIFFPQTVYCWGSQFSLK